MTATHRQLIPIVALLLFVSAVSAEPAPRTDAQGDPLPDGAAARLGTTRFRDGNFVNLVALAPDGKSLAIGGNQGIRILDLATGKELRALKMPGPGFLNANFIAYSPDGKVFGALEFTGRIQFWDPATGDSTGQVAPPAAGPGVMARNGNSLNFSGDGKYVVVGSETFGPLPNSSVTVYEVATGKEVSKVEPLHNYSIRAFLSRDSKLLVTAGQYLQRGGAIEPPEKQREINQTLQLWDPATGKEVRKLRTETTGGFLNVAFSPDGKQMAAAAPTGGLTIFDLADGKEVRRLAGRRNIGAFLAYAPDGKTLAAGSLDGIVQTWDAVSGKRLGLYGSPGHMTGRLTCTSTGKLLAYGTNGQSVYVRDVMAEKMLTPTAGHQGAVTGIRFTADSKEIVTASTDGSVCYWDAAGKENRRVYLRSDESAAVAPVVGRLGTLVLSPDGKHVLAMTPYGLSLFELVKGREVCTLGQNVFGGQAMGTFSADGSQLVLILPDFQNRKPLLRLYDVGSGQEVRKFEGHVGNINGVVFAPDGKTLASVSSNFQGVQTSEVRLWDVATGKSLWQAERPQSFLQKLAFAPDGKTLAILEQTGVLTLLDAANGKELRKVGGGFGTGNAATLSFSPDGRLVAVAAYDFTVRKTKVRVCEVLTGSVRHEFTGHDGPIMAMAFAPDGKRLATGGNDTTVLLWDLTGSVGEEALKGKLTAEEAVKLWTALGDSDARAAHRALRRLQASPEEALALLTKHLPGDKGSDADAIGKMIDALDADNFDERQKAAADLAALGKAAEGPLKKALTGKRSAEAKRAIQELLGKMKDTGAPSPDLVRPLRVVELLEDLGTPEARKLLETLAKGRAEAPATEAAKEALVRLDRAAKP